MIEQYFWPAEAHAPKSRRKPNDVRLPAFLQFSLKKAFFGEKLSIGRAAAERLKKQRTRSCTTIFSRV